MLINEKNIKLWSSIGPRATLGLAINELSQNYEDLVVLTSDVSTSAGLDRFKKIIQKSILMLELQSKILSELRRFFFRKF